MAENDDKEHLPWGVICPDGTVFKRCPTERRAAQLAAWIDTGYMYPFHGGSCGPHGIARPPEGARNDL